jgi:hypothetical protein
MVHRLHRPTHAHDGRPTIAHYPSHCTFRCLGYIGNSPGFTWYVNQQLTLAIWADHGFPRVLQRCDIL